MPRRRLKVVCSSSDEEDDAVSFQPPPPPPPHHRIPHIQLDDEHEEEEEVRVEQITLQTINLSSSNSNSNSVNSNIPNPTNTTEPIPFNISDDDMDDVVHNPVYDRVEAVLRRMGLGLRREWLEPCIGALQGSVHGFSGLDDSQKAQLCFEQFLFADMNHCGAGVLPRDVHTMHLIDLKGPFILQVDEMVNIGTPLRSRYQKAAPGFKRCLKLSMTDGVQRVFGMEYRPIKDLTVLSPAGLKIVLSNVNIRRGVLLLVPEVIEVLGGKVEELDAAQQRLVEEINKPARGRRLGVPSRLSERASLAAWPVATVNAQDQNNISRMTAVPIQEPLPGGTREEHHRGDSEANQSSVAGMTRINFNAERGQPVSHRGDSEANQSSAAGMAGIHFNAERGQPVSHRGDSEANQSSLAGTTGIHFHAERGQPISLRGDSEANQSSAAGMTGIHFNAERGQPVSRMTDEENDMDFMDAQEFHMVDDLDHHIMLTGERETPFTYLASLSAKWATMKGVLSKVQGKVKCLLTGVRGFQYKGRDTYELYAYVDDGSLISQIRIDHNVVQNALGYSPKDVCAALASSVNSQVSQMKAILVQFQRFLANFEGIMVIEMNEESAFPIAIEMEQGCPVSDAWLLLQRLSPSAPVH